MPKEKPAEEPAEEPVETDSSPQPAEDEQRKRFREALERKHGSAGGGGRGGAHGPGGPSLGATANAKTQRTFRRKSGG